MGDSSHTRTSEWDELEARSLIAAEANGAQDSLPKRPRSKQFLHRQILLICLLALCAVVTLFKEDIIALMIFEHEVEIFGKIPVEELRSLVLEGKKGFDEIVKQEYGEYAEQVFDTVSVLKYFKTPNDVAKKKDDVDISRERLKRRMKIKIIESQISEGTTTFTWAVGGHSAAAGHGNLFHQAYGNIIEQSLKGVFGSLGINFNAKNYAMGGTKSAPETALCMEAIYGTDIDIISWDFGMIDGRAIELYNLWSQRAGAHPTRPILFSFGQRYSDSVHEFYERSGGAGFEQNYANVKNIFPNSDDDDVDTSKLPPAVRNYICGGHTEVGEPCGDFKWDTNHTCPAIRSQTSWHNGWKDHLLIGRLSAAFILETFLQAIDELSQATDESDQTSNSAETTLEGALTDPHSVLPRSQPDISLRYLAELRAFENKDKQTFLESMPPNDIFEKGLTHKGNFTTFQKAKSFCRTSMLPSQARYDGVVTGEKKQATYLFGGKTDYADEGHDIKRELPDPEPENNSTELMLVYNTQDNRKTCNATIIDFKDLFYARYEDQWMKTTLPNDEEMEYFDLVGHKLEGIIMLCTLVGAFGRFPADYVTIPEFYNQTTGLIVNGIKVSDGIDVHEERCYVLKHGEGEDGYFFPANDKGSYQIQIRVPRKGNLYLTSMVVL